MRLRLIVILASILVWRAHAQQSSLNGNVLRLTPTALPAQCNTGDLQVDPNNNYALSICAANVWSVVSGSQPNPTTTLGDMIYNNGTGLARLAGVTAATTSVLSQTGNGTVSAAPVWTAESSLNVASASSAGTASTAGTAAFAAAAGTAAAATAFTVTPTGCAAGTYAQFISANGNLTCATVSTASQAGTAAFAATVGTASAINFVVGISQGGTGQTAASAAFFALAPCAGVAGGITNYASASASCTTPALSTLGLPYVSGGGSVPNSFSVLGISGGGTNNTALSTTAGGVLYMDGSKVVASSTGSSVQFFKGGATPSFQSLTAVNTISFTSGSGVYTPSVGVLWLRLRMIGGGGSGGTFAADGTAGAASTFGNMTASGGNGGGSGGVASQGGTAFNCSLQIGGGWGQAGTGTTFATAGFGGASFFGGGGAGGTQSNGSTAGHTGPAYGSGGGGGLVSNFSRAGGAAGGYCESIITALSTTYSYSVGAGGNAPAAAGSGAPGIIFIEEHFQ